MKRPSFSRCGARHLLPVLIAVLTSLAAPDGLSQVLLSDFEAAEGFTAGQAAGGKGGWSTGNPSYTVTNSRAFSGTQSLSIESNATSSLNRRFADGKRYDQLSFHFGNPQAIFGSSLSVIRLRANLGIQTGETPTSQSLMEFSIQYGANSSAPLRLQYRIRTFVGSETPYDISGTVALPTGATPNLNLWTEFSLSIDSTARTAQVSVAGVQITPFNLGTYVTPDAGLYELQFWGHSAVASAGSAPTYYDRVMITEAVPEPGGVALMGLAGAGLWMIMRRRSL